MGTDAFTDLLDAGTLEGIPFTPDELAELGRCAGLTPRQQQVLTLLIAGYSYREIADRLELTAHSTVQTHIEGIRRKILPGLYGIATEKTPSDVQPAKLTGAQQYGLWPVYVELIRRICKARPCVRSGNPRKYQEIAGECLDKRAIG
jgi:hypothetical protein